MPWYIYALGTAILVSVIGIIEKKVLFKETPLEFSWAFSFYLLVFSLPLLFFIEIQSVGLSTFLLAGGATLISSVAFFYIARGMEHTDISVVAPLLGTAPAVTTIIALIFLGESLGSLQYIGVGLVVVGAYVLNTKGHHSIFDPLRLFLRSKSIHYIAISLVFHGMSSVIDRVVLSSHGTDPLVYITLVNIYQAIFFFIAFQIFFGEKHSLLGSLKKGGILLPVSSLLAVLSRVLQANAVKLAAVGLVIAVKRFSIIIQVLVGGTLFHEKNLYRKLLSSVVIITGIVLLIL